MKTSTDTFAEVCEWLKTQGWRDGHVGPNSSASHMWYRRFRSVVPNCFCNDDKPGIQVVLQAWDLRNRVATVDVDFKVGGIRNSGSRSCYLTIMDKSNRVAFNVTDEASDELDAIASRKGWSRPEVFKRGFTLLRLYLQAIDDGAELHVVKGEDIKQIVLAD